MKGSGAFIRDNLEAFDNGDGFDVVAGASLSLSW